MMGEPPKMLPAAQCLKGRQEKLASAPAQSTKHFIKKTPLYPPWPDNHEEIVLGVGCFWCNENLFMREEGIYTTFVGYAGGETLNPSYEEVCTGQTNHNEVVKVVYDPSVISLKQILDVFWKRHDPTTPMQYRSGIYYFNDEQRDHAEASKKAFQEVIDKEYSGKTISTEILPAPTFYYAEDYHQQYDAKPGSRQYCGLRPLQFKGEPQIN